MAAVAEEDEHVAHEPAPSCWHGLWQLNVSIDFEGKGGICKALKHGCTILEESEETHKSLLMQLIDMGTMSVSSPDKVCQTRGGEDAEDREDDAEVDVHHGDEFEVGR